jgi:monoamine oxidase
VNQNALDKDLTKDDRERLLALLRSYGDLKQDLDYQGSERSGVSRLSGAGDITEVLRSPLDLHSLMNANLWSGVLFEESFDQQMPMFQPVGGMDRIPYAFAQKLGKVIRYRSTVKEIRKSASGVTVIYQQYGTEKSIASDYCVCAHDAEVRKK